MIRTARLLGLGVAGVTLMLSGCSSSGADSAAPSPAPSVSSVAALKSAAVQAGLTCTEEQDIASTGLADQSGGYPAILCGESAERVLLGGFGALPSTGLCDYARQSVDGAGSNSVNYGLTIPYSDKSIVSGAQSTITEKVAEAEAAQAITGPNWFIVHVSSTPGAVPDTLPSTVDSAALAQALGGTVTTIGQVCDLPTDTASYPETSEVLARL